MTKVIRDPIWGDIKLGDTELEVVDDPQFQRLRGIKQLGLAYLVYPGATHSRFLHSIGTVAAAQSMMDAMKNEGVNLANEDVAAIRMVALLHDLGHTPFGHLLEDEAGMYPRHDTSPRLQPILESLEEDIPELVSNVLLGRAPSDQRFMEDIVANTICADLIDYIQRDGYFSGATGLRFKFDDRLLGFFRLVPDARAAIRMAIEPVKDKIRLDVITDLLQLLRYRYVLTERITYHHAKIAASAMLVKAVTVFGRPDLASFAHLTDDQFLQYVSSSDSTGGKIAKTLIDKLVKRRLHKPVFRLTRRAVDKVMPVERFAEKYGQPDGRNRLEEEIVNEASSLVSPKNLGDGDIVVYTSPDHRMTFKEVNVLVKWKGEVAVPLREIPQEEYWESVTLQDVKAMEDKYGALWTAGVFIDPGLRDVAYEIEKACERVLGMENDPLLRLALGKEPSYSDMVLAEKLVDDTGLARLAVEISQRTAGKLTREERLRSAVKEAIRIKGGGGRNTESQSATKRLEGFGDAP